MAPNRTFFLRRYVPMPRTQPEGPFFISTQEKRNLNPAVPENL